ncbi:hypothetical protein ACIGFK_29220 [Streptomyces sp. NPDC085524]|uniref:hypothetical protein n=1 Tax=Streptomyces sp. NPDC085524 TaxID=3365728 RepID=UPI0037D3398C
MGTRMWTAAGLAGGLLLAGGSWYTIAGTADSTSHAVCGPDLTKDPVVADEFMAMAVVETVKNTRAWTAGGSSFLSSRVRVLKDLKGTLPETLTVTQGIGNGFAPGRYSTENDELYAVLEPGHRYVVGVETMDSDGQGPWVGYVVPAKRGVDGEAAHWQEAQHAAAPAAPPCNDVVSG